MKNLFSVDTNLGATNLAKYLK